MGVQLREDKFGVVSTSFDVASVAANTTVEQDFTVPGLRVGDFVAVNKPGVSAGAGIVNARVKAANTLSLTIINSTAAPIDPAKEAYLVFWMRPEITTRSVIL